MERARSRYGLLAAALGAALLAVSVFLPWYSVTPRSGAGLTVAAVASAGRQPSALSGQQTFEYLSVVLLALAALALLDALLALLRTGALPSGAGASLALLGAVSTACVGYHLVQPPEPSGSVGSPALREGVWLALLGSLLVLAGGLWPREGSPRVGGGALGGLRGPTPQS